MSGFYISTSDFQDFPEDVKKTILSKLSSTQIDNVENYSGVAVDLSSQQAALVVKALSTKTRAVLKAIMEQPELKAGFWCKPVAEKVGSEVSSLTGVWSGLTRRVRTVTGDPVAVLFDWVWSDEKEDYFGTLHPITIKNLQNALNVK